MVSKTNLDLLTVVVFSTVWHSVLSVGFFGNRFLSETGDKGLLEKRLMYWFYSTVEESASMVSLMSLLKFKFIYYHLYDIYPIHTLYYCSLTVLEIKLFAPLSQSTKTQLRGLSQSTTQVNPNWVCTGAHVFTAGNKKAKFLLGDHRCSLWFAKISKMSQTEQIKIFWFCTKYSTSDNSTSFPVLINLHPV